MKTRSWLPVGLLAAALLQPGLALRARPVTVADLLEDSPASDWRRPDPADTLYLQIPAGRVVVELTSLVAPLHVDNIRRLARAHYYDGLAIVRVQDNYVIQLNDPDHTRPLPPGIRKVSPEFTASGSQVMEHFQPLAEQDVYADQVGFLDGFPAARDRHSGLVWLAHCYGMVGVGRDDPAESDATELYAVIGNAPRQLDRNVTLVGRIIAGVEKLSSLPRGSGEMGFYTSDEKPVPVLSVRVASDLPAAERTPIEVLRTDSATFHSLLEQRRERREPWFKFNPGHLDLCSVPLPSRMPPAQRPNR